jgi:hypothetical protein
MTRSTVAVAHATATLVVMSLMVSLSNHEAGSLMEPPSSFDKLRMRAN